MSVKMHELIRLRDKKFVFEDREEAGKVLADMLSPFYQEKSDRVVVLAIPSGGVPVGIQIALGLSLPLDLLIVRKVPIPGNPEAGIGALTIDGGLYLNEQLISYLHLTPEDVEAQILKVKEELKERNRVFRQGRPSPDVAEKTVILADDGLASGYTMLASVDTVRKKGAGKVVVAVPTSSEQAKVRLGELADEIYCPNFRTEHYYAVAESYRNWYDLDRNDVIRLLSTLPENIYPGHGNH
ncbi:Phosphoribosyl transferase domain protein [Dissulfuribacter thermophilus]|uniref:Phosphoribosyl transferase domain protein n=1 Tax=Dissulfuribacter thermophilus TaxID=1156395 RepID=A0A1B9F4G2_9BACT|nr:phosphoribosyltransferase family protein [Dissulfuribacter thermophilus]OCC14839.1 Phosphoribosyl transferase domain protein [Dissulfuribacter thermophilus]